MQGQLRQGSLGLAVPHVPLRCGEGRGQGGTSGEGPRLVCKHTASPQLRAAWSPRVRRKSPLSTAVAACLLDRV